MQCISYQKSPMVRRTIGVETDSGLRSSLVRLLGILGYAHFAVMSAHPLHLIIDCSIFCLAITAIALFWQSRIDLFKRGTMHMMMTSNTIEECLSNHAVGAKTHHENPSDFRELSAIPNNIISQIDNFTVDSGFVYSASADSAECGKIAVIGDSELLKSMINGWLLISSTGDSIEFSLKKFRFMKALFCTGSIAVSRLELLKALEYRNDKYGNSAFTIRVHEFCCNAAGLCSTPKKFTCSFQYRLA